MLQVKSRKMVLRSAGGLAVALLASFGFTAAPAQAAAVNYGTCNANMVGGKQTLIPAINRGVYGQSPGCTMKAPFSAVDGGGNWIAGLLQTALVKCEGKRIAEDNNYGSGTAQAVREVQAKYGLTADGIYGPKTGAAIYWYIWGTGQCVKGSALGVGF